VRFGDHQPEFAYRIIDPALAKPRCTEFETFDPRYYTSDCVIDAVNFTPVDLTSALDTLDAPYLPLLVRKPPACPRPILSEQKKILKRCHGMPYRCVAVPRRADSIGC
jgi:hypothetical protein